MQALAPARTADFTFHAIGRRALAAPSDGQAGPATAPALR